MDELNGLGVKLVMISIGKPEVGKKLVEHLAIPNLANFLFVDPENVLYDALTLNKGMKETFFTPSTPVSFLNRFTQPGGSKELFEVLSKWNKAIYIPPKQDQAFNQGGTFLFDGEESVFAHYDESTGAHSDIQQVIDLAKERINAKQPLLY
mmetsp:Transcript_9346/g.19593  ORF Transcript_9346/g.19593 Transcript_9346/m.19593 type:complete len:151 (+) Transcript_9346:574-1026(+)